jgi:hypothetical protein
MLPMRMMLVAVPAYVETGNHEVAARYVAHALRKFDGAPGLGRPGRGRKPPRRPELAPKPPVRGGHDR